MVASSFERIMRQKLYAGARGRRVSCEDEVARLVGGLDEHLAPVARVRASVHQPAGLRPVDQRGDRRGGECGFFGDGARRPRALADKAQAAPVGAVEIMGLPDRIIKGFGRILPTHDRLADRIHQFVSFAPWRRVRNLPGKIIGFQTSRSAGPELAG